MKPSSILRTLSFRIPVRLSASPAIAPLPIIAPFDRQATAELDTLLSPDVIFHHHWLCHALNASINTQKIALESLTNANNVAALYQQDSNRKSIEEYLDDGNIKLLDSCNEVLEKIEAVQEYVKSLKVVSHLLQEGKFEPSPITLARARNMLEQTSDVMERRLSKEMKNYRCRSSGWSSFRKLSSRKKLAPDGSTKNHDLGEFGEILNGSKAVALMVCQILGLALSSMSSKGCSLATQSQPTMTSWSCSLKELQNQVKKESEQKDGKWSSTMLSELQETMALTWELRRQNHIGAKRQREIVEELNRRCEKLEDEVGILEEGVRDLYRHLVSVRMALLGILSKS
ncbi:unnamed protein product [Dovyalis caffra]|uniref:Uncharacterized protein n=1 Tax=Dovyalis caffra TaxID=77055 RepID=A0AAV1SDK6_9ROSI|nr:unnamed protein product [Dovyalis caffra]